MGWSSAASLRHRDDPRDPRTTAFEGLYDFVFAMSLARVGQAAMANPQERWPLALAGLGLWLCWMGFTFVQNRFVLEGLPYRMLGFVQVVAAIVVGFGANDRWIDEGFLGLALGAAHLAVAALFLSARTIAEGRDLGSLWAGVFFAVGVCWIGSGVRADASLLLLGGAASVGALLVPLAGRSRALFDQHPIDFEHLARRMGTLTLGVLGFAAHVALSGADLEAPHLVTLGAMACGVWWLYFGAMGGAALREGAINWVVWLYTHLPLHVALVVLGVSAARVVSLDGGLPLPVEPRWLLAASLSATFGSVAAIDSVTQRESLGTERWRINTRWLAALVVLVLGAAGASISAALYLLSLVALTALSAIAEAFRPRLPAKPAGRIARAPSPGEPRRRRAPGAGNVVRKGAPSLLRRDFFFYLVDGSWLRVVVFFVLAFVITNVVFAGIYMLDPYSIRGAEPGSFADAFAFSVQTMSTIGYGALSPNNDFGDTLVAVEAAVTMLGVAIVTGFVVAKATRPKASVLFSRVMTVTRMNGRYVLAFRVGNARGNEVVDANVTVSALIDEVTQEGHHFRKVHDLPLQRSRTPVFSLSWTVVHEITDESPLAGIDWANPDPNLNFLVVTLTGHDGTYGQTIYARHNYYPQDARLDEHFVDVLRELDDGRMLVDYTRFHDTKPGGQDGHGHQ